ncbi:MAG: IS21 family transposase, partial [Desulfotomaculaceae bacterium]
MWIEYCAECRQCGDVPFMYTQFCYYYREYIKKNKATMHIGRKPGEIMEVDWAGDTATVTDSTIGKELPAYIFVAVLPYSQYAYVEAFHKQDQEAWISAHVNAYKYFGGATRILVCDNLR